MQRQFTVVVERGQSGILVGHVPGLHGAHSQGANLDELMENMKEVIELCVEESGDEAEPEFEFVGVHRLAV